MTELGEAYVVVRGKFDKFDDDMAGFKGKLTKGLSDLGKAGGLAVAGAAVAGGVAVAKFTSDSIGEFVSFQDQMNEVFTLLPGMSKISMDDMSQDVLKFAKDFGVLPEEIVPALYQALSAGVPPDNVFNFLETANAAAVGGITELETSVDGITSVVNAYGADMINAAEASDLMFTAVKLGKTDFEQLSNSLFNVIPTAASLGIEFEEVTAAMATMTAQGTPTSVATTQLRQLFVEATKDGSKLDAALRDMAGKGMADMLAEGKSFNEVMSQLRGNMTDEEFRNLFGSVEALNAALATTGPNVEMMDANMAAMQDSTGATQEAFGQMNTSLARSQERAAALMSTIKIGVGSALAPLLNKLVELGEQALPFIEAAMEKITPVIEAFAEEFGDKLGPAVEIILRNLERIAIAMGLTNEEMDKGEQIAQLLAKGLDVLITTLEVLAVLTEAAAWLWENFGGALKTIINPIWGVVDGFKEIKAQLSELEIPEWFTPGSPTPLELGIRGIGRAIDGLPDFGTKFNTGPTFGNMAAAGGSAGNTTIVNVDGVSAMSQTGDSVDEAIRLVVQLLRQRLKQ